MESAAAKRFVIPYVDQGLRFWEKISVMFGSHIKEVYFPIQESLVGTGRPALADKHLPEFLESGILPVALLINPVVLHRPVEELSGLITEKIEFYIKSYNITGVTISNLALAGILRASFPDLHLTASTLMEIFNEQQLVMLSEVFDCIVPSGRVLRNFKTLKMLRRKFNGKIRIMVNESCLPSCVYRTQHFFEMSNHEIKNPQSLCSALLNQKPWLRLTGGWILPQHLHLIKEFYDEIKLSGRISLQKDDRYFTVLDSYINGKSLYPHEIGGGPASVNTLVPIEEDFYSYTLSCKKDCLTCDICHNYWAIHKAKYE